MEEPGPPPKPSQLLMLSSARCSNMNTFSTFFRHCKSSNIIGSCIQQGQGAYSDCIVRRYIFTRICSVLPFQAICCPVSSPVVRLQSGELSTLLGPRAQATVLVPYITEEFLSSPRRVTPCRNRNPPVTVMLAPITMVLLLWEVESKRSPDRCLHPSSLRQWCAKYLYCFPRSPSRIDRNRWTNEGWLQ